MASRGNGNAGRKNIAEFQKERRRVLQARHRATLTGLFDNLRNVVCPSFRKTPAKSKILHRAKSLLKKQEARLSKLLSLKGMFLVGDDGPCSLKEVRDEYRHLYCQSRYGDLQSSATRGQRLSAKLPEHLSGWGRCGPGVVDDSESSSEEDPTDDPGLPQFTMATMPNIQEFEGYLIFYRQIVEGLLASRVLLPEQTGLPVVSEAISCLWESLPPERRTQFQICGQEQISLVWASSYEEPPLPDTPVWSSQTNSQGATGSSGSIFEEDLLLDSYDVVERELDLPSADRHTLPPSPLLHCSPALDSQKLREIYKDIVSFVKIQMLEEMEFTQDPCLAADYEAGFLRCTETFDDDL